MLTRRQLLNRLAREAGESTGATYQTDLAAHDRVRLLIVEQEPPSIRRLVGRLLEVLDHGHYMTLVVRNGKPEPETVVLWRDGPPDWGVVECRILSRWRKPARPDNWS